MADNKSKGKSEFIQELIIKLFETYTDEEKPELFTGELLGYYNAEAPKYGLTEATNQFIKYHLDAIVITGELVKGTKYVQQKGYPYKQTKRASPVELGEASVMFLGGIDTPTNMFNRLSVADKSTKYPVDTWNKLRAGFMLLMLSESEDVIFDPDDYREYLRNVRDTYIEQMQFISGMLNDSIWAKSSLKKIAQEFDFLKSPVATDEVSRRLNKLYNNEISTFKEDDAA